jgi:uncharacterized membrane protein
MWNYFWPIVLIVGANTAYNIIAKSTPSGANAFLSLTVTYLVAAAFTLTAFFLTSQGKSLPESFRTLNWTSFLLGFAIVGLETGYIFLYRAGWKISVGSLVANILLAVMLIAVGVLFYKEQIGVKQIAGIVLCIAGLLLINL